MPVLGNTKHELFCQNVANGQNQSDAYINAGFKATKDNIRKNANKLATKTDIKKRIEELQKATEKKNDIERSDIIAEIEIAMKSCFDPNTNELIDKTNYLKALDMKNKMSGQYSEKRILEGGDKPLKTEYSITFGKKNS